MVTLVALYARVSSEQQVEGFSIEAQLRAMREHAGSQGWKIFREYVDEGFSAATAERPQFQVLLRDAKLRLFDGLLIHKLDRLYRNVSQLLDLVSALEKEGIALISVLERVDFSSPSGKMLLTNIGMISEFYLNNLREETVKGKYQRALAGFWNSDIPFGYCKGLCSHCTDPNGKGYCPDYGKADQGDGKSLIPHPKDSLGLALAFRVQADQKSDLQVAQELNSRGYRSNRKLARRANARRKGGPHPFCKDTVRTMLQNPFYLGFVHYRGQLIPGKHKPLVDQPLFDAAQQARQRLRRVHGAPSHKKRFFLFSGLIRCAKCGYVMRGRTYNSKHGEKRHYIDTAREHGAECKQSWVLAEPLEQQIEGYIQRMRLPKHWVDRILQLTQATEQSRDTERKRLALRSQLERLQHLFIAGDLNEARYEQEKAKLERQLEQLPADFTPSRETRRLAKNVAGLWAGMADKQRQQFLNTVFKAVYVWNGRIERVEILKAFKVLFE